MDAWMRVAAQTSLLMPGFQARSTSLAGFSSVRLRGRAPLAAEGGGRKWWLSEQGCHLGAEALEVAGERWGALASGLGGWCRLASGRGCRAP